MDAKEFYNVLKQDFGHQTTTRQDIALQKLSEFILDSEPEELFLLKGFAGTGKTTITSTIVKNIWKVRKSVVLAAPTGRAAKVLGNYAKQNAQTIHRKIYFPKSKNNNITFSLRPNKHRNTLFIVDEASMIPDTPSDAKLFENGSLLNDLIEFVDAGFKCRLLLIGDTAQLPPVKLDISPALDEKKLMLDYNREVTHIELNEVVRQSEESDILLNATQIRHILEDGFYDSFKFNITQKGDVVRLIDGHEIMDAINDSYSQLGHEDTCIVVRSNKRANLYNQNIRQRILFQEEEISAGDYFMVVKNNYFWVKPTTDAGFIANGDIVKVLEIFAIKELYGFRFAEVNVQMVDYPNMKPFETVVLLDTLTSNTASLSFEESNQLYQEVMKDYADVKTKYQKFLKVKNNKFFNALQVKFSYAITCHKSQGGQWDTVFVEQPYLPDGIDKDYLRWLYTAITRAKSKLYLIGFKNEMFEDNSF
ncbi:ATP-dependent DNA helicase [Croceibacter atlanticus]|jgi:exodeoxyribonuclease-5|uniref:ATP-dependent exoDNAse (Exonuclease V), alpha subunit-helicase superfamily I member n=1 Tax=Croceibacter atlanticus (strain ATCC BAA-628 / JCM 21780 / CIP 108009 / IAM 15332 / KCTC 12090 / HTCC2559) TaxID=216432 RepID=A3U9J1_CROAH|nr:AAA family ATPase [Croceibacter atlanticus]EAP86477.1 ATP-dependent exoDNAse (exonuclease V), alpha subunit - helicase superfamily I member [Croceibacter atlanticus HTCC2559]MBW4971046.1 AAA family ATPase [Croceibacter atlanticus]